MVTLGMSAHTDRMIKLLVENGVTNTAVLERLLVHGIPRVSLLYSSLSPSAEIWIKYIYNICIIYIMSSNSYWTLLMPTSILQGFAHFCPFLKGFFQHSASTTPTQPGWFDHGEKKPRSQWWSMHGTQFAMGLGGSCTKTLDFRKDELGTLGYQELGPHRSGWVSQKRFDFFCSRFCLGSVYYWIDKVFILI